MVMSSFFFGRCFWQVNAATITHQSTALDIVKLALTIIGGVGAVSYLVIKYQERQGAKRAENRTVEDRTKTDFINAVHMLSDSEFTAKIAGVYMLADIGDRERGSYCQKITDILCGHLRTRRNDDGAVETTITQTLKERLDKKNATRWEDIDLDLHDATLNEDFSLEQCEIHKLNVKGATFNGLADFSFADFAGLSTSFADVTFNKNVAFQAAKFHCGVTFRDAKFNGNLNFAAASIYNDADFRSVIFGSTVQFDSAEFRNTARFSYAWFAEPADFHGTVFEGTADFDNSAFPHGASFTFTIFAGPINFKQAKLNRFTNFDACEFSSCPDFPAPAPGPDGLPWLQGNTLNGKPFSLPAR